MILSASVISDWREPITHIGSRSRLLAALALIEELPTDRQIRLKLNPALASNSVSVLPHLNLSSQRATPGQLRRRCATDLSSPRPFELT